MSPIILAITRRCTRSSFSLLLGLILFTGAVLHAADSNKKVPVPSVPPAGAVIRVGVLVDNYPYSYKNDSGTMEGFSVDLLAAIERIMSLKLERIEGTTTEINKAFLSGSIDMLQSYAEALERRSYCDFSVPYLPMSGSIIVKKGTLGIRTIEDLRGKRILVHRNSLGETTLLNAGMRDYIVYAETVEDALRKLHEGLGDATLATRLSAISLSRKMGIDDLEAVGDAIGEYKVRYAFALRLGQRDTLAQINEGLAILQGKGRGELSEYDRIYAKWFSSMDRKRYSKEEITLATSIGLALALIIAVWASLHQKGLRKRIARQAEELRLKEQQYRGVFESSLEGLIVLSKASGTPADFSIEQCNPAVLRIFDLAQPPKTDSSLRKLHLSSAGLCDRIAETLSPGKNALFEYNFLNGSKQVWIHCSVAHIEEKLLVVLADVSEAKEAEERLHQSQEQPRQTQKPEALGTLASGIAHVFNNILTGVIGNAELASMDTDPSHPSYPCLEEILRSSDRAKALVRQILAFSRKAESKYELVSVNQIVGEVLRFLRATTPSYIEIKNSVEGAPSFIKADPNQMHQVLMNLCTNSIQAMKGRPGVLEIIEQRIDIGPELIAMHSLLKEGLHARLSIRDSGCGMTPEVMQRIFEPFFTTKAPGEGTGLGLSVVHGIMQKHGGAVTVYSQPDKGTAFHLYFPLSEGPIEETSAKLTVEYLPRGRQQRVLFLDDEKTIANSAGAMLKRLGYTERVFTDASEAMQAFATKPSDFDVVVTDLTMPKITGLDVSARIRTIRPDIPIILASGYMMEGDRAQAKANGVQIIIDKPITMQALASALATCLENS